jgi:hypothetical protein
MSTATRPVEHAGPPRWPGILAWAVAGGTVLSLVPSVATVGPVTLAVVSSAAVGAPLASRRPRHPVGWLLLGPAAPWP